MYRLEMKNNHCPQSNRSSLWRHIKSTVGSQLPRALPGTFVRELKSRYGVLS